MARRHTTASTGSGARPAAERGGQSRSGPTPPSARRCRCCPCRSSPATRGPVSQRSRQSHRRRAGRGSRHAADPRGAARPRPLPRRCRWTVPPGGGPTVGSPAAATGSVLARARCVVSPGPGASQATAPARALGRCWGARTLGPEGRPGRSIGRSGQALFWPGWPVQAAELPGPPLCSRPDRAAGSCRDPGGTLSLVVHIVKND